MKKIERGLKMSRISERVNIAVCVWFALLIFLPVSTSEGTCDNEPNLLELTEDKFGKLNEAEEDLFRSVADGKVADRSDKSGKNNDPNEAEAEYWDPNTRVIRADLIAWLCTDRRALELATHRGIQITGARIEGELDLSFAIVPFPLRFRRCSFKRGINLRDAEIRNLDLNGTYTGPIYGDRLKVEGSIYLCKGFKAKGEVNLYGSTIEKNLECIGGHFINEGKTALNVNGANIKGNVFLSDGFKAEGEVNLNGITIGMYLICDKGRFIRPNGYALRASSMKVKSHVFMRSLIAKGEVKMSTAKIDGTLQWRDINSPGEVTLRLSSVTVAGLWDDKDSWPGKGKLFLHGLVYNEICEDAPRSAEERIEWLRRQYKDKAGKDPSQFHPQPYEQLAVVLRKGGQDEDARKVLIAKNMDKAKHTKLTLGEWLWYQVFGWMIGYGYRPWRALWGVLLFVVLGWILFGFGYRGGLISPESDSAFAKGDKGITIPGDERKLSEVHPKFNFLMYSIDTFVPLIDLHQSKYWLPNTNRDGKLQLGKFKIPMSGKILRYYLWFHIAMGWALSTLLVVGLTGLVRT